MEEPEELRRQLNDAYRTITVLLIAFLITGIVALVGTHVADVQGQKRGEAIGYEKGMRDVVEAARRILGEKCV